MLRGIIRSVVVAAVLLLPAPAAPNVSGPAMQAGSAAARCRDAARAAATRYGIPDGMMQAIALVESRREVGGVSGPWPWTLNIGGKGYWYDTRGEALARAAREIGSGRRSVDLGCFQLNYRWHGENFNSLDEMLDPELSADYAARFLGLLFAETGDWMRAAGFYHSRTPVFARRYRRLLGRALAGLDGLPHRARVSGAAASASPDVAMPKPPRAGQAQAERSHALVWATARAASDPTAAAAPGAVMLRMFARPARPLLAVPGTKP